MFAIAGALLIGLSLGLLGSGGSILTVPVLVFLVGEPEKLAIAESLGIVSVIAGIGALQHARQQHVDWRSVWLVGPPAMIGSYAGAWLSQWLTGRTQLLIFAGVMLIAAYRMFMNSRRDDDLQPGYCRPWCLLGLGTGLGILSGLVGVGGGFLIVPALVLLGGLPMSMAVGTSLLIICMSSLIGFAKHLLLLHADNQTPHWPMLLMFVVMGILGSLASQPLGRRLPQVKLQRAFSAVVVMMAAVILWQAVTKS
jgi:uncharacterized protein